MLVLKCNLNIVLHLSAWQGFDALRSYLQDTYHAELKLDKNMVHWNITFETEHHLTLFRLTYSDVL